MQFQLNALQTNDVTATFVLEDYETDFLVQSFFISYNRELYNDAIGEVISVSMFSPKTMVHSQQILN